MRRLLLLLLALALPALTFAQASSMTPSPISSIFQNLSSDPANASLGSVYYNTVLQTLRTCVSVSGASCTSWVSSGGSLSLPAAPQSPTTAPTVINVQLASSSDMTSITSNGTVFTITCPIAACGLTNGVALNLGMQLPVGCADATGNTLNASGNTIQISNTGSCTASAGPYHNQLGQVGNAIFFQNTAATGTNYYARMTQTADGHTALGVYTNGVLSSILDMQSGAPTSLSNQTAGIGFSTNADSLACMQSYTNITTQSTCKGFGVNSAGVLATYNGASASGLSVPVFKSSGNNTGALTSSNFYTAPASGLGGNTMYHLKGVLTATSAVASATAQVNITFTPRVGSSITLSTCGTAANLICVSTTGVQLSIAAVGNTLPFDFTFELGNSQTVSLTVTDNGTNHPVYDYFYQLYLDNN